MTRSSMVSQSSTAPVEPPAEPALLVVGLGCSAVADYAAFTSRAGGRVVREAADCPASSPLSVVVWLPPRLTDAARAALDSALAFAVERGAESVTLISSARAHLGDPDALAVEA